ncbi:MAG: branched-chain amino acid ABC transporter permease [Mogibacterium sp.]|jgi:branched-chain amino acid transport system permease protein|nr:branched-chain amino acid ABC transporter permease [Mogibacterium sp.]
MAERILKNIRIGGLKNAVKGNDYRKEATISYGILIGGYILLQILTAAGLIGHNLQGQFVPICVYISLAVSLNLVVGISGELSLGHAGFMAVGAFSGILMSRILLQSMSFEPAILIISMLFGALMASIAGFIIGIPILGLRGDYLAIVTLAFGEIIRNFMNVLYFGFVDGKLRFAFNHTIEGIEDTDRIITGAIGATGTKTMASFTWGLLLCLFTVFIVLNLKNSKQGRAIMSIRDNRIAGESIGLDVRKYKLMAFVVSAALAGMAGCLFGLNYSTLVPIKFNFNTSVLVLVFVVLGGVGNIWGGIIAATLLTILPETFRQFADYRMLTYAIVLILVMIGTYNPAIKSRVNALFSKIKPKKKKDDGKVKKKKSGKEGA